MAYFTIPELCSSSTAARLKLSNTPTPEIKKHLEETIKFLDRSEERRVGKEC